MSYEAIIVGARCAGSPLARFLARAGQRVVLVDAATFPSDQPLSTHFIHPFGMRVLDELGVGDRVRAIAPPVPVMMQSVEEHEARFHMPFAGSCPRRIDLDQILLEGAREAGAEVRLGERVIDLLRDGTRIVGVVTESRDGARTELRGDVVVGADGRSSTVADLVGAEKYFNYEGPRAAYWAYWPRPTGYDDAPYGGATLARFIGDRFHFSFPANRDQLIIGVGIARDEAPRWKADPRGTLLETLAGDSLIAPLVKAEPLTKIIGLLKLEYFFRRAAGPGWALVGDAGLHKDPTGGFGISDALRDARALAAAILEGGDHALERYWRQRDVDSFELYSFARDMGELDYNNPLNRLVFAKFAARKDLCDRVFDVLDRRLSPYDMIKPSEILRWTFGALLRGRFGVLRPFFKAARRQADVKKELDRRRALLVPALPAARRPERAAA